jgi:ABC-type transporter Mla maintaining outer membrane lipid asymmetry ATPase subunit MlaF
VPAAVVALSGVIKAYGGLRPLRLRSLQVREGEQLALAGFDQTTAELFVNLVTGATLPDEGVVTIFGRSTADITDSADWLATVESFGIVSERAVLLEQLTAAQNIAMSLTLDVEPIAPDVRTEVDALAHAVGLAVRDLDLPIHGTTVATRHRIRAARALAGRPSVLLVEHPIAGVEPGGVAALATDIACAARSREAAVIVLAAGLDTARPFAERVLTLDGATGELHEAGQGGLLKRWFSR